MSMLTKLKYASEAKNGDHFSMQSTPQRPGKLTSETTFDHLKVVFRPLVGTNCTFSPDSLVTRLSTKIGDWGGTFTYLALNASSGEFRIGVAPQIKCMFMLSTLDISFRVGSQSEPWTGEGVYKQPLSLNNLSLLSWEGGGGGHKPGGDWGQRAKNVFSSAAAKNVSFFQH